VHSGRDLFGDPGGWDFRPLSVYLFFFFPGPLLPSSPSPLVISLGSLAEGIEEGNRFAREAAAVCCDQLGAVLNHGSLFSMSFLECVCVEIGQCVKVHTHIQDIFDPVDDHDQMNVETEKKPVRADGNRNAGGSQRGTYIHVVLLNTYRAHITSRSHIDPGCVHMAGWYYWRYRLGSGLCRTRPVCLECFPIRSPVSGQSV
jgi:hypothetical protein